MRRGYHISSSAMWTVNGFVSLSLSSVIYRRTAGDSTLRPQTLRSVSQDTWKEHALSQLSERWHTVWKHVARAGVGTQQVAQHSKLANKMSLLKGKAVPLQA
jgi:hypothetical protein